ncbi:hypothetical protein OAG36_00505 [bacterium]|nr:hypothetical protein [bacterium]
MKKTLEELAQEAVDRRWRKLNEIAQRVVNERTPDPVIDVAPANVYLTTPESVNEFSPEINVPAPIVNLEVPEPEVHVHNVIEDRRKRPEVNVKLVIPPEAIQVHLNPTFTIPETAPNIQINIPEQPVPSVDITVPTQEAIEFPKPNDPPMGAVIDHFDGTKSEIRLF